MKQSQQAGKTGRSLPSKTYNKGCNKIKSHPQDWGKEKKQLLEHLQCWVIYYGCMSTLSLHDSYMKPVGPQTCPPYRAIDKWLISGTGLRYSQRSVKVKGHKNMVYILSEGRGQKVKWQITTC